MLKALTQPEPNIGRAKAPQFHSPKAKVPPSQRHTHSQPKSNGEVATAAYVDIITQVAALPEHLRLGVTLPGMRELLKLLPPDAVAQVNAKIPIDKKTGQPKYPENVEVNGYVQQILMAAWEKVDKMAVCERLKKQGSPHVGEATVFVSWFLATPIETLLDALANFLEEKGLREEDTYFWVCDYVIRQTDVKTDLESLGDCVSALGHTVLLMEPWHAPKPLKRAYCIKEVYHTQVRASTYPNPPYLLSTRRS